MALWGSLAAGVVVVVVLIVAMQASSAASATATGEATAPTEVPAAPVPVEAPASPPAQARSGTTPTKPPPSIDAAVIDHAEELYRQAADAWNAAQGHRGTDYQQYGKDLTESAARLEELSDSIEPYALWFEEADMEGWSMPAEYVDLQRRFDRWDKLRVKVMKLKPTK